MKQIILMLFAILVAGCGTLVENHYRHMPTEALQLERYQIAYRVNHGDPDDIDRKEAIERELQKRRQIDYRSQPEVIYSPM